MKKRTLVFKTLWWKGYTKNKAEIGVMTSQTKKHQKRAKDTHSPMPPEPSSEYESYQNPHFTSCCGHCDGSCRKLCSYDPIELCTKNENTL